MKKTISLVMIFLLIFSVVGFAEDGRMITPEIQDVVNESNGNVFKLELKWEVQDVLKGDYFDVSFPFNINLAENEYAEIVDLGNNQYRVVIKDDFSSVRGTLGGSKTVIYEEILDSTVINGEVIVNEYNTPQVSEGGHVDDNTQRDRIYKLGYLNGTNIDWQLVIGGDKKGVAPGTGVIDEIGDGHKLDIDSVEFYWYQGEAGTKIELDRVEIIDNVILDDKELSFDVSLGQGEYILVKYKTIVTDFDRSEYSNQVIVEGEQKVSEKVIVDSWGDIDGDKPNPNPEEPEDPKPEQPTDPTLPQVGESYFKIEYMFGFMLIITAFILRRYNRR